MSLTALSWRLEDFNGGHDAAPTADEPPEIPPAHEDNEPASAAESWVEGYMHASRHLSLQERETCPKDELTVALQRMEDRLRQSAESATMLVAHLLLESTIAVAGQGPAGNWHDRIQRVADAIRPALLSGLPEVTLHSTDGETILTATSIDGLREHSTTLVSCDRACVSWRLGRAEYSRRTSVEEMAWALAPLIVDAAHHDIRSALEEPAT